MYVNSPSYEEELINDWQTMSKKIAVYHMILYVCRHISNLKLCIEKTDCLEKT